MTGETLVAKFGRSSLRVPRKFILTNSKFLIISEQIINHQLSFVVDRTIQISSIKYVAMSNLRDDWVALSIQSPSEPDVFISCPFKTELVLMLTKLRRGLDVRIGPTIQYFKKPGKLTTIKFQKDESVTKEDVYKSSTVRVSSGMPPNSVSDPTPKKKSSGNYQPKPRPQPRPAASQARRIPPAPPAAQPLPSGHIGAAQTPSGYGQPVQQQSSHSAAVAAANSAYNPYNGGQNQQPTQQQRTPVTPVTRPKPAQEQPQPRPTPVVKAHKAPPPPPPPAAVQPPPPPQPAEPTYKALYDFSSSDSNQLSIKQGEIVLLVKQGSDGWCLAKRKDSSEEGWTPFTYLQEVKTVAAPPPAPPATRPKKAAPAPPAKKSSAATSGIATPVTPAAGGANLGTGLAEALKQKNQANNSLAGGLADALKARTGRRDSDDDSDDDW